MGAFDFEGSQRPRTMMVEKAVVNIMTLKRPILSAIMPGRIRPNILLGLSECDIFADGYELTKQRSGLVSHI